MGAPRAACSGCCLSYRIFRKTTKKPPAEIDLGFPTEAEEGAGPGWSVTPAAHAAATPLGTRRLDTHAVVPGRRTLPHVADGPDTRSLMGQGDASLMQPLKAGIRLGQNFCSGLTGWKASTIRTCPDSAGQQAQFLPSRRAIDAPHRAAGPRPRPALSRERSAGQGSARRSIDGPDTLR